MKNDLRKRQQASGSDSTDQFLNLLSDPFQSEIQSNSIYAALIYSFAVSTTLFLLFCLLRPRNSRVYAPRAKHADTKHAPPTLGRSLFSWWTPAVKNYKEQELVEKIGLDAVIFLRFLRMLRNCFAVLTVWGCGILIPVNVIGGSAFYEKWSNIATLMKFTPQYIFGPKFWAFVLCSYLFQGTVCFFVWWNYRRVYALRRTYFKSHDYQSSLHSRTLLLTHIPSSSRTDAGIAELAEEARQTHSTPRTAIGRNMKELPTLIKAHDDAVRELEATLAKYFQDPNKLPATRPTCKVAKEDRRQFGKTKVDAIDYLTSRISRLETEIKEVRESVDKRKPESYGFASYPHIEDAHAVAYAAQKRGPGGSDVYLAPKPHDLLWQNLSMSRATRRRRRFVDGMWMVLFTLAYIVPNILTSVFLSDFSHLGLVWPSFQGNLAAHPTGWGIAQGILAPLVQTLIYIAIPILFRRLYTHSGDVSKTSRERHVTARLYAFFVFNNLLVFSVFGSAWRFVASVIAAQDQGVWDAIKSAHLFSQVMTGLCNVSTFWLTWQMQKNLGAAIDLAQAWPLVTSYIQRRFFSPTPRQLIELTAPQPFMYADYYNNYLQIAIVGLCFGTLQPIILPITAFYLCIEVWFKKYLLQYVFITKTESGGRFWKLLVNRFLFAVVLANAVIALVVGAQGVGSISSVRNGNMLYAMIPLPFLLGLFKWYCKRAFDDKLMYYSTEPFSDAEENSSSTYTKPKRNDRIAVRFGHPALYKPLLTPMVHSKSKHLLADLYQNTTHRSSSQTLATHHHSHNAKAHTPHRQNTGYSDIFLSDMDPSDPGHATTITPSHPSASPSPSSPTPEYHNPLPPIELVPEQDLTFSHFKRRAEFRESFGGEGELYGRPDDLITNGSRPVTPSTFTTFNTTLVGGGASAADVSVGGDGGDVRGGSGSTADRAAGSPDRDEDGGTSYVEGYQRTPVSDRSEEGDLEFDVGVLRDEGLGVEEILEAGERASGDFGSGGGGRERLLGSGNDGESSSGRGVERDGRYNV
ncbi:DUF221-domain-containing protein [Periconia macrospinosa]|uniref:DUF221-domain-containing protein n=1 Tax=Periconia macrospinosa TaxID=97972 RepID=A0A2V1DI09_9PLEO|nr:DUF221-domain-containing protein [Periconia macrospinosa]